MKSRFQEQQRLLQQYEQEFQAIQKPKLDNTLNIFAKTQDNKTLDAPITKFLTDQFTSRGNRAVGDFLVNLGEKIEGLAEKYDEQRNLAETYKQQVQVCFLIQSILRGDPQYFNTP